MFYSARSLTLLMAVLAALSTGQAEASTFRVINLRNETVYVAVRHYRPYGTVPGAIGNHVVDKALHYSRLSSRSRAIKGPL